MTKVKALPWLCSSAAYCWLLEQVNRKYETLGRCCLLFSVFSRMTSHCLLFAQTKAEVADKARHVITRSEIDSARFQL